MHGQDSVESTAHITLGSEAAQERSVDLPKILLESLGVQCRTLGWLLS